MTAHGALDACEHGLSYDVDCEACNDGIAEAQAAGAATPREIGLYWKGHDAGGQAAFDLAEQVRDQKYMLADRAEEIRRQQHVIAELKAELAEAANPDSHEWLGMDR